MASAALSSLTLLRSVSSSLAGSAGPCLARRSSHAFGVPQGPCAESRCGDHCRGRRALDWRAPSDVCHRVCSDRSYRDSDRCCQCGPAPDRQPLVLRPRSRGRACDLPAFVPPPCAAALVRFSYRLSAVGHTVASPHAAVAASSASFSLDVVPSAACNPAVPAIVPHAHPAMLVHRRVPSAACAPAASARSPLLATVYPLSVAAAPASTITISLLMVIPRVSSWNLASVTRRSVRVRSISRAPAGRALRRPRSMRPPPSSRGNAAAPTKADTSSPTSFNEPPAR